LPQRELGAQLPGWDELLALIAAARDRGFRLHLDGARLWEAAPHYGRAHAEIAGLFDSVYVSFYKGLNAIAGAALAGDADFIAEARVWQHRLGGRLVALYPLALSAQAGLDTYLPQMARYRDVARAVAAALAPIDGVDIVPDPPHTNTFHIYLRGTFDKLTARASRLESERGVRPFKRLAPTALPELWKWEFVAGEATLAFTPAEIATFVRELVAEDEG
jgi:threonine aldolase